MEEYKIKRFPVLRAEKARPNRSKLVRVLPDGRSVVDANDLLNDKEVQTFLKSLEKLNITKPDK